ncbi:flagellin [Propionivibrio limicola]|uniref:flagellin N-terminal helical domain-containing protein n=1 Tax=Propionivibrio limicola TaxID=167645 RepID=UPI00129102FB|nr:flagellin [Propionivibrio limicola]
MAQVINTNMASLNAQRNLNKSQSALNTALTRLSSGLRINSAKDDAAGLSIATRMSAQIGGMEQAARNANDGISMTQTAEGAMSTIGDTLLRMRELAVQAANDTNSAEDRAAIQNEMDQLTSEIDRISSSTEFNGVKLLDGTGGTRTFQVGANANQTISVNMTELSTQSLRLNSNVATGDLNSGRITAGAATDGDLIINGTAVDFAGAGADNSIEEFKDAINAVAGTTGVTATAYNLVEGAAGATGKTDGTLTITVDAADGTAGSAVTIDASANMDELVDNINKQVGGITASVGSDGQLVLSNETGATITVGGTVGGSGLTAEASQGYLSLTSGTGEAIELTTADGTAASALNKFGFNLSTGNSSISSAETISASSADLATAMADLDTAGLGAIDSSDIISINGVKIGTAGASASDKAAAINAVSSQTGVTASAETKAYLDVDFSTATALSVNGASIAIATTDDVDNLVTAINATGAGVTASTDATTGRLVLTSAGSDISLEVTGGGISVSDNAAGTGATAIADTEFAVVRGSLTLEGNDGASVRLEGTAASVAKLGLVAQGGNSEAIGGKLSVTTVANANAAIERIDDAIQMVSEQRSTMGAVQNRFSTTISNLESSVENLSSSRSRIQDADFAAETSNLTRAQILQQAGTAMLAQAKSLPQQVLSLLQ